MDAPFADASARDSSPDVPPPEPAKATGPGGFAAPADRTVPAKKSAIDPSGTAIPSLKKQYPPWLVPALLSATALVLGLVLGSLLFGGGGDNGENKPAVAASTGDVCPPAPAVEPCPEPTAIEATALGATADGDDSDDFDDVDDGADGADDADGADPEDDLAALGEDPDDPDNANPDDTTGAGTEPTIGDGACSFSINSSPSGAMVQIDGRPLGATPIDVMNAPCDRKVSVQISANRWRTSRRSFTPSLDGKQSLSVTLRRPTAKLRVRTTPTGAGVNVQGKRVGRAPLTINVPQYTDVLVQVGMRGFKTASRTVHSTGKSLTARFKLDRR